MYLKIKRIFDLVLSIILIIILSIPMMLIAIIVKMQGKDKVIYKSKRIGKDLVPFYMYKFKSIRLGKNNKEYITKVGKFIRNTSIDELPQLFNILKGEMSFVGPRPWIPEYYIYLNEKQKRRSSVLPGISGLAQVNGRNKINIFEKLEYDLKYVNNINFITDIKILIKTCKIIFLKEGINITNKGIQKELKELEINNKKVEKG